MITALLALTFLGCNHETEAPQQDEASFPQGTPLQPRSPTMQLSNTPVMPEYENIRNTCVAPTPTKQGAALVYNLDEILEAHCRGSGFRLTFADNFATASFMCFEDSAPEQKSTPPSWHCDLRTTSKERYEFTFGNANGAGKSVNVRQLPAVAANCAARAVGLDINTSREEGYTRCARSTDAIEHMGYEKLIFPNGNGRIVLMP